MDSCMSVLAISSREFDQDAGGAKKAADKWQVIVTGRHQPAHGLSLEG
jgi:hypothetical protein